MKSKFELQVFVDLISISMLQDEKEIALILFETLNTGISILDKEDLDLRLTLSLQKVCLMDTMEFVKFKDTDFQIEEFKQESIVERLV